MAQNQVHRVIAATLLALFSSAHGARCAQTTIQDGELWFPDSYFHRVSSNTGSTNPQDEFVGTDPRVKQLLATWTQERTHGDSPFDPSRYYLDRSEQNRFLGDLKGFVDSLAAFRGSAKILGQCPQTEATPWAKNDPRILPYVKQLLEYEVRRNARWVLNAREKLKAAVSSKVLKDAELLYAGDLSWGSIHKLASEHAEQRPYSTPEMTIYTNLVHEKFAKVLPDEEPGCLLLLAVIGRNGHVECVHVMESSGIKRYNDAFAEAAAAMQLPPLPDAYPGQRWHVLLRKQWNSPHRAGTVSASPPTVQQLLQEQQLSRDQQAKEAECKKRLYGVKYPWQMLMPYAADDVAPPGVDPRHLK